MLCVSKSAYLSVKIDINLDFLTMLLRKLCVQAQMQPLKLRGRKGLEKDAVKKFSFKVYRQKIICNSKSMLLCQLLPITKKFLQSHVYKNICHTFREKL